MPSRPKLREIVATLEKLYGKPAPFPSNDPWELILRENASYLVDDATREEVFRSLKARIGVWSHRLRTAGGRPCPFA
jgi:hypothetical protein